MLPTLDQYNGAVQNPKNVFTDPELKAGKVGCNTLGLPMPYSGGFAITYKLTAGSKTYAVRVFHKKSDGLENRYLEISNALRNLKSDYFIDFTYQKNGIQVAQKLYPIVKMDWVNGYTLADYIDDYYRDYSAIEGLRAHFDALQLYLGQQKIAHGDIQLGNVIIANSQLRLVDYDGMFVRGMTETRSAELGHRHFQHPLRNENCFNEKLDNFSFIVIDLSLKIIQKKPDLFKKYGNTGENIIFTANDYKDPEASAIFKELDSDPNFKDQIQRFAGLCKSPFNLIPSLSEFNNGQWRPTVSVSYRPISQVSAKPLSKYIGAYPVIDGSDFQSARNQVGNMVELVGKIHNVEIGLTKYKSPYIHINFGPKNSNTAKITLWKPNDISPKPDQSWVGKWISVTGMIEQPFTYTRTGVVHVSIFLKKSNSLVILTEEAAKYRLNKGGSFSSSPSSNSNVLNQIRGGYPSYSAPSTNLSPNAQILQNLQQKSSPAKQSYTNSYKPNTQSTSKPSKSKSNSSDSGCLVMIVVAVIILILSSLGHHH